jgi:hypothetical protein
MYNLGRLKFIRRFEHREINDSVDLLTPMSDILTLAQWDVSTLLGVGNVVLENTRNLGSGTSYVNGCPQWWLYVQLFRAQSLLS